jgi:hypothetical protein
LVEQRSECLPALDQVSTLLPEPPERRGRVEGDLDAAVVSRSLDRCPYLVLLGFEAVEPLRRVGAEELGLGRSPSSMSRSSP